MKNRSVPADIILPHLIYEDVPRALAWLIATFGFIEHYRYGGDGGPARGAQIRLGNAVVMLNSPKPGGASPKRSGCRTQSLTVFVDDVDAHFAASKSAGAKIVEELNETIYGERQYGVEDLEGHLWLFSRHARDAYPGDWRGVHAPGGA